jgi:hypothetical protein
MVLGWEIHVGYDEGGPEGDMFSLTTMYVLRTMPRPKNERNCILSFLGLLNLGFAIGHYGREKAKGLGCFKGGILEAKSIPR